VTLALAQARARALIGALDQHGGDIDSATMPSDLIVAAAAADDTVRTAVGPYARMDALSASLDAVEPNAREIFTAGWRPAIPDGPTRDELADLCAAQQGGAA
jgi:hypothetical protein